MKFPLIQILIVIISSAYLAECDDAESNHGPRNKRITDGTRAADRQFPFMAFIYWLLDKPALQVQRIKCTGVIIHPKWVLSSANCFDDLIVEERKTDNQTMIFDAFKTHIRAGVLSVWNVTTLQQSPGLQDLNVTKVYVHTTYTKWSTMYDVDVALLELNGSFDLTRGDAPYRVSLADFTKVFRRNDVLVSTAEGPCFAVGYGLEKGIPERVVYRPNNPRSDRLSGLPIADAHVQLILEEQGNLRFFPVNAGGADYCHFLQQHLDSRKVERVDDFYACAKSTIVVNGPKMCWGDNGGALLCNGKLVAIMSQRRERWPCAGHQAYAIYTMVGHPEVYDWITRFVSADVLPLRDHPTVNYIWPGDWPT